MQLAPLASCRQNPERGSGAQGTRGWRLRSCGTRRNADAAGFSCPGGGDSLPPGLSEIDLKLRKRVVAPRTLDQGGASGAAAAAPDRKIPPVATPAPVGQPPRVSQCPAPLSLNLSRNPVNRVNCLNRPPSLPSPYARLVGDRKRWRFSGGEVPSGLVDLEKDLEPEGIPRSGPGSNSRTLRLPGNPGTTGSHSGDFGFPKRYRLLVITGLPRIVLKP